MGTPSPAAVSLQRLLDDGHEVVGVYTQPDRPSGRGNKIVLSPVKELALKNDLPVRQPLKIKTDEALEEFKSFGADVAAVVAYGRILPEGFLTAFPMGAINVHFSLLPKYRGAAPVNWAIVNGERRTGVTTIRMDAGLDTGDILLTSETEIGANETAPELIERLSAIGADVLAATLDRFDELAPRAQDHEAASFAPIMKRGDGLVDWNMSAREISNRVRGFQPFPGTYTFLQGKRMVVWSAAPVEFAGDVAPPGQIVSTTDGAIIVAAGDGTMLRIDEIQFEGKRRTTVREVLHGGQIAAGVCFGGFLSE